MKRLLVLSSPSSAVQDQHLLELADLIGVSAKAIAIDHGERVARCILDELSSETSCIAMSADTLAAIDKASVQSLLNLIERSQSETLVFNCSISLVQDSALSWLTGGVISGIIRHRKANTVFTLDARTEMNKQLAGLKFFGQSADGVPAFKVKRVASLQVIMAADQDPVFVHFERGSCQIFFLASDALPDINAPLHPDYNPEAYYDRVIPLLIFLRQCFGENCWHGREKTARLIIDDPLLIDKYGFLDFDALIASMRRSRYGTTVAFIPWNHWRTSQRNTSHLLGDSSNIEICIHGCDHTNKEFDSRDTTLLGRKAALALQRMELLREHTGAAFEPIMVFPQGCFSTHAIAALRGSNYLAAVNSTVLPTNIGSDDLTIRDLLWPAVTRYNGFPIFLRHYSSKRFDVAFDLFLGKPALIVEHHDYFRDGCRRIEEFVDDLYNAETGLSWPPLGDQLTRSCLERRLSDGSTEVRFFTRKFQLSNREEGASRFLLTKYEPDSSVIKNVLVDGTSVPFSFAKDFLTIEVPANPGRMRNIEVVDREQQTLARGFGLAHNTRVLVRRGLSEFRDNTLARHNGVLKVANKVAKGLKLTGES